MILSCYSISLISPFEVVNYGCSIAVTKMEYCRHGVKHKTINRSIMYQTIAKKAYAYISTGFKQKEKVNSQNISTLLTVKIF